MLDMHDSCEQMETKHALHQHLKHCTMGGASDSLSVSHGMEPNQTPPLFSKAVNFTLDAYYYLLPITDSSVISQSN